MTKTKDAVSRWEVGDNSEDLRVTDRDVEYLYKLFVHFFLSTVELHELVCPDVDIKQTRERLRKLRNRPECYVQASEAFDDNRKANHQHIIYSITPNGVAILLLKGKITKEAVKMWERISPNYRFERHDAAGGWYTFSVELGCKKNGWDFIGWDRILTHEKLSEEAKKASNPLRIYYKGRSYIEPDTIFAIRNSKGTKLFLREGDTGEQAISRRGNMKASSWGKKLPGYFDFMHSHKYVQYFGISSCQVIMHTVNPIRMMHMMEHLQSLTKDTKAFMFIATPFLHKKNYYPPLSEFAFDAQYERVGYAAKRFHEDG